MAPFGYAKASDEVGDSQPTLGTLPGLDAFVLFKPWRTRVLTIWAARVIVLLNDDTAHNNMTPSKFQPIYCFYLRAY